uniref:Uncharacterized protein n=1 Tax=Anguilla anguilla TaxID=7936 RepID=A0A0E9QUH5_ANGAN
MGAGIEKMPTHTISCFFPALCSLSRIISAFAFDVFTFCNKQDIKILHT